MIARTLGNRRASRINGTITCAGRLRLWGKWRMTSIRHSLLGVLQVYSRRLAAAISLKFIGHALLLIERRHASALHGRDVDESIAAAIFRRDEAIALVIVEEF